MNDDIGVRVEAVRLAIKICEVDNTYDLLTMVNTIYAFLSKGETPNE